MEMREHILASAQRLVQQRGFNGFSYADIAEEVGIRKASLHYHFPTKTDLGLALIETYSEQFDSELFRIGDLSSPAPAKLKAYVALYRGSLEADRICLCGMLATEALTLDATMLPKLKRFFTRNTEWLTALLTEGTAEHTFSFEGAAVDHARMLMSALQGASLVCRSTGDRKGFDRTAALLISTVMRKG